MRGGWVHLCVAAGAGACLAQTNPPPTAGWNVPGAAFRARIEKAASSIWPAPAGQAAVWVSGQALGRGVRVFRTNGTEVAAGIFWRTEQGDPVKVVFDTSSGDAAFWLYPAEGGVGGIDWRPQAGVLLETRQLGPGGAAHWAEFRQTMDASTPVQERSYITHIHQGVNIHGVTRNFLSYCSGYFHVGQSGKYRFATLSQDASFKTIDDGKLPEHDGRLTGAAGVAAGAEPLPAAAEHGAGGRDARGTALPGGRGRARAGSARRVDARRGAAAEGPSVQRGGGTGKGEVGHMKTPATTLGLLLAVLAAGTRADENEWLRPLGPPPVAPPRRISGGEGLPPLPLPATPLRRSERKREPKPPTLIGKVVWGETASFTYEGGHATEVADWNMCPADAQQLLRKAQNGFGLPYGSEAVSLAAFDGDPGRLPVLLFSGGRTLKLDATQTAKLRAYVLGGGMLIFDAIAGSPYFHEAARQVVRNALPEFELRTVPPDHPVYHLYYDVDKVRYPKNLASESPVLEGVYVGCRLGAVISKYGLGCGWDDREVPLIQKAVYYDVASANQIGLNLVAYAVGYGGVAREEAKPELFGALDEKHPTDEFVFAQIRHEGAWNVHPGGAAALLRRLRQNTALRVSLKRTGVTLGQDDLTGFTFLYLTGLDDFRLSDPALAALRHFLNGAGTLLINNGLGLRTFDQAVRRELRRVLPESALMPVPANHPLYSGLFTIGEVRYTPAVEKQKPDLKAPLLEGIAIDGDLRVIYSPFDLECAWQGCDHPLARAYDPPSGTQLGMNIVMYAMSH